MTQISSPANNASFSTSNAITIIFTNGPATKVKVGSTEVEFSQTQEPDNGVTTYTVQIDPITTPGTHVIKVIGAGKEDTVTVIISGGGPSDPGGPGGP